MNDSIPRSNIFLVAALIMAGTMGVVNAAEVAVPNTFTGGTRAVAAEVNANFSAIATEVNDNHSRIAALEAAVATLQASVSNLESRLAAVEGSQALALEPYLSVTSEVRGPLVRFSGVNLQVVNGAGQTASVNGLGNVIIGYDAPRDSWAVCSDGQYMNSTTCQNNGETWAQDHKSGSHNIVGGDGNSYSGYGGLVLGQYNVVNRAFASVVGGYQNMASGTHSTVAGGDGNWSLGPSASVAGGDSNLASGRTSSVSGGNANEASGADSAICGGFSGVASGASSTVSGGTDNIASGDQSSVSGGNSRSATAQYDWAAGGLYQDQ